MVSDGRRNMKQFLNRKMNVKKIIQKNKMPILVFLTGIGILTGVIGKTRADNRQSLMRTVMQSV